MPPAMPPGAGAAERPAPVHAALPPTPAREEKEREVKEAPDDTPVTRALKGASRKIREGRDAAERNIRSVRRKRARRTPGATPAKDRKRVADNERFIQFSAEMQGQLDKVVGLTTKKLGERRAQIDRLKAENARMGALVEEARGAAAAAAAEAQSLAQAQAEKPQAEAAGADAGAEEAAVSRGTTIGTYLVLVTLVLVNIALLVFLLLRAGALPAEVAALIDPDGSLAGPASLRSGAVGAGAVGAVGAGASSPACEARVATLQQTLDDVQQDLAEERLKLADAVREAQEPCPAPEPCPEPEPLECPGSDEEMMSMLVGSIARLSESESASREWEAAAGACEAGVAKLRERAEAGAAEAAQFIERGCELERERGADTPPECIAHYDELRGDYDAAIERLDSAEASLAETARSVSELGASAGAGADTLARASEVVDRLAGGGGGLAAGGGGNGTACPPRGESEFGFYRVAGTSVLVLADLVFFHGTHPSGSRVCSLMVALVWGAIAAFALATHMWTFTAVSASNAGLALLYTAAPGLAAGNSLRIL